MILTLGDSTSPMLKAGVCPALLTLPSLSSIVHPTLTDTLARLSAEGWTHRWVIQTPSPEGLVVSGEETVANTYSIVLKQAAY